ncbi:MAG: hypothetical protein LVR00_09425 [Rhabdochlamydiaceae bacterium]|jgi:hypothetical protein
MKKWLIAALFVFAFCNVNVNATSTPDTYVVANIFGPGEEGLMVLTDTNNPTYWTYWHVYAVKPRTRNIAEWWNGVELVPSTWQSSPKNWSVGERVVVDWKSGNLNFFQSNAANGNDLLHCDRVITSLIGGEKLLAKNYPDIISFLQATCSFAEKNGYQKGFKEGKDSAYTKGVAAANIAREITENMAYNDGYKKGHKEGYDEGFKTAYNGNKYNNESE